MVKRKRSVEETVQEQLQKFGQELHHALKLAKGFERQRQAKRLKDPKAPAEKKERLQKEIFVLKVCVSRHTRVTYPSGYVLTMRQRTVSRPPPSSPRPPVRLPAQDQIRRRGTESTDRAESRTSQARDIRGGEGGAA